MAGAPPNRTSPFSGVIRPSAHLMATDLPVPDPPMITSDWPGATVRSTPRSTSLPPKRLWTFLSSRIGAAVIDMSSQADAGEDGCEDVVGGEDQHRSAHDCQRRRASDAAGASLRTVALVAAHDGDDGAE